MPADIRDFLYPTPKVGLSERLRHVHTTEADSAIEVLYVQPAATQGDRCIDFDQFAAFVERHDDPLSRVFASHPEVARRGGRFGRPPSP